jgi:hypothetical protein
MDLSAFLDHLIKRGNKRVKLKIGPFYEGGIRIIQSLNFRTEKQFYKRSLPFDKPLIFRSQTQVFGFVIRERQSE